VISYFGYSGLRARYGAAGSLPEWRDRFVFERQIPQQLSHCPGFPAIHSASQSDHFDITTQQIEAAAG
jgi:hypothetical protein